MASDARTEAGVSEHPLDIRWQWLILIGVIGLVIWLLAPVLMPFVLAALIAYLGDPVVDRLERHMPRTLAVSLVFLVMIVVVVVILLVLVPFVEHQISNFLAQLPTWIDWFQTRAAPWLEQHLGISTDLLDTQQLIGVLQAREELLDIMPPWQGGGSMIKNVTFEDTTYADPPAKFEAGTPNIADAVGLGAALDYVRQFGLPNIAQYEHELLAYGTEQLSRINGLRLIGTAREKLPQTLR